MNIFGEKIRLLRKNKNLKQQELADIIGISIFTLKDIEYGKCKTTLDRVIVFADFFDVSIDYLVGRSDNPNKN
jgi:transcriptional regulator with XRE-family HTH domain